jgi:F-type H+-transporting ATPase subunit gamma
MASLRQIRRRMKSIENINEITKAMEMIAAFRFKKAEGRFLRTRSYFAEMEKLIANLAGSAGGLGDALFAPRDVKKKALVVMTGDKGLCGAYNTNLIRAAIQWTRENAAFEPSLIPVAKVGFETFRKRQLPVAAGYPEKASADLALAKRITGDLKELYLSGRYDSIEILYAGYRAGGSGVIRTIPFLGLRYLADTAAASSGTEYLFEPTFEAVFSNLLEKYLEGKMYVTLLESLTSEHSARMVAMKQASENGEEVLHDLKLLRNKTRQATITRELSEIVSGASVLA